MCFFPDYDKSILSTINSILKHYGVDTPYKTLPILDKELEKNYKNVVLLIFDGMGSSILEKNISKNSFLCKNIVDEVCSVFPPTTAAAIPTYHSGLPPAAHGWLAWTCYIKEHDKVISLFRNQDFYTGEEITNNLPQDMLKYETVYEKIEKATNGEVTAEKIYPAFINGTYNSLTEMKNEIMESCKKDGRKYIMAYSINPDNIMHREGTKNIKVRTNILKINDMVKELARKLKDTLLIISADHSLIDVEEEIFINKTKSLKNSLAHLLSFEDRVVSVFLKEGRKEAFLAKFRNLYSDYFEIFTKEEVIKKQIFGKCDIHKKAIEFIGDLMIVSKSRKSFRQMTKDCLIKWHFKGAHSGGLKEESIVPIILIGDK